MRKIISLISFATGLYFLIRYRYKIVNSILSKRWLRSLVVKLTMQIPYVRNKFMNQMFRSQILTE